MDQLSKKMDAVLEELRSWREKALVEPKKVNHHVLLTPQRLVPAGREDDQDKPRVSVASNMSENAMMLQPTVRQMDLHNAYKYYAKEISTEIPELELDSRDGDTQRNPEPVLRMVRRTTLDQIWETLDDPNSSNKAWWISQFQSLLVLATLIFGTIQTSETPIFTPTTVAVVETSFDSLFCLEFVFRILSAPSKWMYFSDPVNWADIVCVLGLPLRASVGFVFQPVPQNMYEEFVQVTLIFFLPIFRFLKLLRYFEITRLLIDACSKAAEAVPVLSYMMALIVLLICDFHLPLRGSAQHSFHAALLMAGCGHHDDGGLWRLLSHLPWWLLDRRVTDFRQCGLLGVASGNHWPRVQQIMAESSTYAPHDKGAQMPEQVGLQCWRRPDLDPICRH